MSGFVATATIPAATGDTDAVGNDGWFPALSMAAARAIGRFDGTVTDERLRDSLRYAMLTVNAQLVSLKAAHQAAGRATLADASSEWIDGEPRLVTLYRRAVLATVQADLTEAYRTYDLTDAGQRRAAEMDPAIGEHRRNASWAIRDLLGKTHSVVELI